jgi:O-methyltransferase involved in polyketide biosynthesis
MRQQQNNLISSSASNHDFLVMGTAEDAMKAKMATVQAGYYDDPYINEFSSIAAPKGQQHLAVQVIIKRGTYARVACIQKAISSFLVECFNIEPKPECAQVIVLGSGKDTSFFRILDERRRNRRFDALEQPFHWFEVDHAEILQQKAELIHRSPAFASTCSPTSVDGGFEVVPTHSSLPWHQAKCHLLAHNLNLNPENLIQKLIQSGISLTAPTLVVCECVLMYMTIDATKNLLSALSNYIDDCTFVSYEPILGLNSSFGRVMQDNLTKIGVVQPLSCLLELRMISHWLNFFASFGCKRATSCDMYTAYETVLSVEQRSHAQHCEFLDELEEFILIMQHYCLTVSNNNVDSNIAISLCEVSNSSTMGFVPGRCEQLSPLK